MIELAPTTAPCQYLLRDELILRTSDICHSTGVRRKHQIACNTGVEGCTSVVMDEETKEQLLRANPLKGTNQIDVRGYNERLVLQLIREHGSLTKAEATRATGLSPNASSVIFRALESEGLIIRGDPIRGRVGQPSTPLRINPDAHHYVSLRVGRRSIDIAVVNFVGEIESSRRMALPFPTPKVALEFFKSELGGVLRSAKKNRKSISGMSVAMPFELWSWTEEFGAPKEEMEAWRDFDIAAELQKIVPWKVLVENDGTAACRAEQVFGSHTGKKDWVYFFVGTFIGGGIVLNGSVFPGSRRNSGGFGPMRVPEQSGGNRLVDHASLVVLERSIAAEGGNPFAIYEEGSNWDDYEPLLSNWISNAALNLSHAIVSSLSVLDFDAAVIDGAFPSDVKKRLVSETRRQLSRADLQGVHFLDVEEGQVGRRARTISAAAAFVSANYMIDQNTLHRN
ncbi:MarR family transcriptional regulator [Shimia abyssi]|uniref:MarR family transcriptional regulator n=2 Tax=Shimia abyssi TaxID=1662395 RepID=A0A2P8F7S8_9RHOB|nr:MarR family transcriptional regulator [Shimia abyssi]